MNYYALRVEKSKKDHEAASQKLASITIELDVVDH
jgi:hypothetical protein